MEQNSSRGRGKPSNNARGELRRPNTNVLSNNTLATGSVSQDNSWNSAPSSNAMPTSESATRSAHLVQSVPISEHASYDYCLNSDAVNAPTVLQSNMQLDPHSDAAVRNSNLSPLAKEFVPKTFVQGEAPVPSGSAVPSQLEYMVYLVQEFIYEVTGNPGKFDSDVVLLTDALNVMVKSNDLTKAVVEIIFKQAVCEPNFRYNGARLCNHLTQKLVLDSQLHVFRFILLEKCQTEFEQRNALIKSNPEYLRGLVFFFGELYSQIQTNGQRLDTLRNAIICFLDALLTEQSRENVKCACQVIKMTGANLDDDEKHSKLNGTGLEDIFRKLADLSSSSDLKAMVTNVIQLKSTNWGRSSISIENQSLPGHVFPGGAVFYGPDGQPMSSEETMFLENQSYYDCRLDSYDEDFNDEMAADYENFLRDMGQ